MSTVSFRCPIDDCRCHNVSMSVEISFIRKHIKSHDYRVLLQNSFNLGIISSLNERRSVDWLVDELFRIDKITAGVVLH